MGIKLASCSQSADDFMTSLRCIRGDTVDASVAMALVDMVDTARRTRAIDARPADRIGRLLVLRRELPRIAVTTRLGMPIRRENRRLDFLFFSFFRRDDVCLASIFCNATLQSFQKDLLHHAHEDKWD